MTPIKLTSLAKQVLNEVEADANTKYSTITWKDGTSVDVNKQDEPIGQEYIGEFDHPGEQAPKADMWYTVHEPNFTNPFYVVWSPSLKKWYKTKVAETKRWTDGVTLDLDKAGDPVGYKYLGWVNSGISIPKTDDWREFYYTNRGHHKTFSPKLKVWYETDSGD